MHVNVRSFLFLAFIVLIGGCSKNKVKPLEPAPVQYKSDDFPYTVSYDLNRWRILPPSDRQMVMAQADVVFTDGLAEHFLAVSVERSGATVSELRTRALIALQQKGPDLQVLSQGPVTVANSPALQVQLQATIRDVPLAFRLVFLQYGGNAYQLAYWSSVEKYMDRVEEFDDFLRSFQPHSTSAGKPVIRQIAYPSPKRGYIITLPYPEWRQSIDKLSDDADQQFQTETGLTYMMVIAEPLATGLDNLSEKGLARLREASRNRFHELSRRDQVIDDVPTRIVFGRTDVEGNTFDYAILFAVHNGFAYQVAAWAPKDLFSERYQTQFVEIFKNIQFL
jgi:hypothetical protein